MTEPIRVLVVDDQPLVREGFSMLVRSQADMLAVGQASDGLAAVELTRQLGPDVVLMDVRMPGIDGVEATRRVVDAQLPSRVLILTTFDLDEHAFGALRAGASGFLLKDAEPDALLDAIRTVHSGHAVVAPSTTARLLDTYLRPSQDSPVPDATGTRAAAGLTDRERQVWVAIARGLSNAEIAAELWVSETTVKTHVGRILAKTGARDRVGLVILAYDAGAVSA
ncbi:response regulator [Luteipulveratus mongoliensis]|uniref:LuxR family transcriptional regulator n=1 Tax=Luteipulveratus mongoliensis TaxID=571913 RepID=A0A0K1JME6_9MICO|nr:response regulator transcription factor [Luteipulveratus mongoliensis]AKU17753.1 LuxR family transcriptional regulator [Luteipulveratus mongoliensis]